MVLDDARDTVANGHVGLMVKALAVSGVFLVIKWLVWRYDLEFISTLPLLTALMGGVVFTLAILLAGVLADFKESERIVGELASQLRRIYWDAALIAKDEHLERIRRALLDTTRAINANLRDGSRLRLREIYKPMEELDRAVAEAAARIGPTSPVRTMQVHLGGVLRVVDRLEAIVETTFVKAGYYFAATAITVAITGLTFTQLQPFWQGLFLYGFAVFLLVGLFWLIADLDNPFDGNVRVSMRQLEKLEVFLAERTGAGATSASGGVKPLEPAVAR